MLQFNRSASAFIIPVVSHGERWVTNLVRTAIVGTGFSAALHARALQGLGHRPVAVVGASIAQAEAFAAQWSVERFSDDLALALAGDIQCVHICTPPALHAGMLRQAIQAGKHVVCEKPLCLDPAEARDLLQLAREKQVIHALNFNARFYDACLRARQMIIPSTPGMSGFGPVHLVHGVYLQEFHALPAEAGWRYQPELAGPMRAVTEIGSHWIDLARFWTGLEIVAVSASFGCFTPDRLLAGGLLTAAQDQPATKPAGAQAVRVDSEDAAVIALRFSNGAIGSLLLSEVSHGRYNNLHIEVTGAQQSIWWNSETPDRLHQACKASGILVQANPFAGGFPDTFRVFIAQVYQDMARGRPDEHPAYATFQDGAINAAVCAALYASAQAGGRWVKVANVVGDHEADNHG